jgi:hypothetical protein
MLVLGRCCRVGKRCGRLKIPREAGTLFDLGEVVESDRDRVSSFTPSSFRLQPLVLIGEKEADISNYMHVDELDTPNTTLHGEPSPGLI